MYVGTHFVSVSFLHPFIVILCLFEVMGLFIVILCLFNVILCFFKILHRLFEVVLPYLSSFRLLFDVNL